MPAPTPARPRGRLADALLRRPAAAVVVGFALAAAIGAAVLMLPAAAEESPAGVVIALFTAVSALFGGLVVVDTLTYWSAFGELAILVMMQVGGIGIMTLATLLGLLITRRIGLRLQLTAQEETKALGLGEVRAVTAGVVLVSLAVEAVVAAAVAVRFAAHYAEPPGRAIYLGVFHSVSAFNNAGFALFSDNMISFATDGWICLPLAVGSIVGGLGFPVLMEAWRRARGRAVRWSLHVRITVITYMVLLVVGVAAFLIGEWTNPGTLGRTDTAGKLVIGLFHGVQPRTTGFNSVDMGQARPGTLLITDLLMFVGGGSGSTAGGIKVTTFALLAFVMLAEVRGDPTVHVLGRRLPGAAQRQAVTVALAGVGLVMLCTIFLLEITPFGLDAVLFEVVSAFGTVGLSTGITAAIPPAGLLALTAMMFLGGLGPITLASALALRERGRRYELPEERTIIG
jgi:Trk-type K+ transport system membrane component